MEIFGQALYFSEDLLLPPPHTYFLIDLKEISNLILSKVGGPLAPQTPRGHATSLHHIKCMLNHVLFRSNEWTGKLQCLPKVVGTPVQF